ncbi:MAG TPA: 5-(carboxyamino)imidazole ribonucleotide synthase [Polyangiaceae bacterium]|nr:5-(carboxyamino)imidazole ribonucleotide synthase [Polyangiaceae bacterium]
MSSTTPIPEADGRGPLVGVLGAGQLGRMLALAGYELGLRFLFVDPSPQSPAGELAEQLCVAYDDPAALERLAQCDVVTYEFESVPAAPVEWLTERVSVFPPAKALGVAQDRLAEKSLFQRLGIPTAPFFAVDSAEELAAALEQTGYPAVLKTRRLGYDGKGQFVLKSPADREPAWRALGGVPLLLEGFVAFQRELSLIAVRGRDGNAVFYSLVENEHRGGILRKTLAPAPNAAGELQAKAEAYVTGIFEALDYVGVLTLELFQKNGELYANEIAPRVHNSGHHSIESARTSQFENHLRAVLGLPLGSTELLGCAAMRNLIGALPDPGAVLAIPDTHLHRYGKAPRTGRKVGHVTLRADDERGLQERLALLEPLIADDG